MRRCLQRLVLVVPAMLWACGGGEGAGVGVDVKTDGPGPEVVQDVSEPQPDYFVPKDTPSADTKDTAAPDLPPEVQPDTQTWQPTPCQSNDDCVDGFCLEVVPGSGEFYCAPTCIEECPGDWVCKMVYTDGPDPVSVCLPPGGALCRTCQDHEDCLLVAALCVKGEAPLGFCATTCNSEDPDCPDGYECRLEQGPDEEPLGWLCMPVEGACCAAGEWVDCEDDNQCTAEACQPGIGCVHEDLDGIPCLGDDPCQIFECVEGGCEGFDITTDPTLDGKDDDCDGLVDEDAYKHLRVIGGFVSGAATSSGAGLSLTGTFGVPPTAGARVTDPGGVFDMILGLIARLGLDW